MPTEFKIPELGENVESGDVVRLLVKPGDSVARDQPVLELETDKATIEVPSNVAGTVKEIKVKQGDKVKVGQVVLTLDEGAGASADKGGEASADKGGEASTDKGGEASTDKGGEASADKGGEASADKGGEASADKGGAKEARAQKGSRGAKPQPAGAAEEGGLSQAAVPEREEQGEPDDRAAARGAAERTRGAVDSEPAGRVQEPADAEEPADEAEEEETPRQRRGEVVDISRGTRPAAPAQPAAEPAAEGPAPPAAPSVRRIAREFGVDIHQVQGSGPEGRISLEDVQTYVRSRLAGGPGAPAGGAAPAQPLPDFSRWGEVERKPMSNIRRKTAEHLGHAWRVIPHVTQHDRADVTAMEGLRKRYAPQAERAGGKLTMTAIALKIAAGALERFPQFNSAIDQARNELVYRKYIHVGVAVDTPRGLLVPVIRDVNRKGIFELSKELTDVSEKARTGKLSLDEMQGGGFTITNLGGIGGTSFTPIVNWPEVAILGISRSSWEPAWRPASVENAGSFDPRLMLPFSLSYDHRVIDGADAARFLRWICEAFEQPFLMAL